MGMYTELVCAFELPKDTPKEVIETLEYMVAKEKTEEPKSLPDHPLFETDRWRFMLVCDSYYFTGTTNSTIYVDGNFGCYYATIRCNLKNYCNEIEHFVDWISRYAVKRGKEGETFIGYKRYEENENPELIYI